MATLTLYEQQLLRRDQGASPQEMAVRAGINRSELNPLLPFQTIEGGSYGFVMEDELPGMSPRMVNEANDDSLGTVRFETEHLKIYGKDIKTDIAMLDLYGPRAHRQQVNMNIRAMRYRLEKIFFGAILPRIRPRWMASGPASRLTRAGLLARSLPTQLDRAARLASKKSVN